MGGVAVVALASVSAAACGDRDHYITVVVPAGEAAGGDAASAPPAGGEGAQAASGQGASAGVGPSGSGSAGDPDQAPCVAGAGGDCGPSAQPSGDCGGLGGDVDRDGWCALYDNCPNVSNADQSDLNGNGIGDACDKEVCNGKDDDGDGTVDNGFADTDQDGVADCVDQCENRPDVDVDQDGVTDCVDPCPGDPGNDPDADGVCAAIDNCPGKPNYDQGDVDKDGIGNACDVEECDGIDNNGNNQIDEKLPDADGDTICDAIDKCPDDVDNDIDKDGLCAGADNCAGVANADQKDSDGDKLGDACDLDAAAACGASASIGSAAIPKATVPVYLVVDPTRNLIYATVGNVAGQPHANEFLAIDPVTHNIIWSLLLSTGPRPIALSDDGSRAYVGFDSIGQIQVVDLKRRAACYQFLVGGSNFLGNPYANEIVALPGHPETIVATVRETDSSFTDGVLLFDDGAARARKVRPLGGGLSVDHLVPVSAQLLYGVSYADSLVAISVDDQGAHSAYPPLFQNAISWSQVRYGNGLLYGNDGQVIDPTIPKVVGKFAENGPFALDTTRKEIFFVYGYYYGSPPYRIDVFDTTTFLLLRSITLPSLPTTISQIERFGVDGLVLRTGTGLVFTTIQ